MQKRSGGERSPNQADGGVIEIFRDGEWVEAPIMLDGEVPLAEWLIDADRRARRGIPVA